MSAVDHSGSPAPTSPFGARCRPVDSLAGAPGAATRHAVRGRAHGTAPRGTARIVAGHKTCGRAGTGSR
jgi:hypothetical protein